VNARQASGCLPLSTWISRLPGHSSRLSPRYNLPRVALNYHRSHARCLHHHLQALPAPTHCRTGARFGDYGTGTPATVRGWEERLTFATPSCYTPLFHC